MWGFEAVTNSKRQRAPAQGPRAAALAAVDRPVASGVNAAQFGSDVVADALRATGIDYIALNPGASYRGFHDSLVNYLSNERPQMLLCLHEESAIAIAHGYAKVTGRAMAARGTPAAVVPPWMSATSLRSDSVKKSSARWRWARASTHACTTALRVEPWVVRAR